MPFTGSSPNKTYQRDNGTYTGSTVWAQDEANGQNIESSRHDSHDQDIAAAINTSLQTNGANKMTAGLPGYAGTNSLPGYAFSSDLNTGLYRKDADNPAIAAGGALVMDWATTAVTVAAPILCEDGTTSAPSVAAASDTETGLFWDTSGSLSIVAGGAVVGTFTSSAVTIAEQITVASGNAMKPAINAVGDTNTGLYFSSANEVSISCGNSQKYIFATDAMTSAVPIEVPGGDASTPGFIFDGSTNTGFFQPGSSNVAVTCGGTEAMRWDNSGNTQISQDLWIGATSLIAPVTDDQIGMSFDESEGQMVISSDDAAALLLRVRNPNSTTETICNFRFGTGATVGRIDLTSSTASYETSSDARLKENIRGIENPGEIVDALKPCMFDFRGGTKNEHGLIAQEAYEVYPRIVGVPKHDLESGHPDAAPWSVDYSKLTPLLLAEIQQLRKRVAHLEETGRAYRKTKPTEHEDEPAPKRPTRRPRIRGR